MGESGRRAPIRCIPRIPMIQVPRQVGLGGLFKKDLAKMDLANRDCFRGVCRWVGECVGAREASC